MNEYTEQFAKKHNVNMKASYRGHYPRLGEYASANFLVTLTRPGKKEFSFEFSNSLNDSWRYTCEGERLRIPGKKGIPMKLIQKYWPRDGETQRIGIWTIYPVKKSPTLYDILACLTKYDPGTFKDFCADFGYDEDSRKAFNIYIKVQEEWEQVYNMFSDCLEELQEIS